MPVIHPYRFRVTGMPSAFGRWNLKDSAGRQVGDIYSHPGSTSGLGGILDTMRTGMTLRVYERSSGRYVGSFRVPLVRRPERGAVNFTIWWKVISKPTTTRLARSRVSSSFRAPRFSSRFRSLMGWFT